VIENPFAEEVAPARRLTAEAPPSKHAKGRTKALSKKDKARRRNKMIRESRNRAMDQAVLCKLEIDGPPA
jgi:hypothetical protein